MNCVHLDLEKCYCELFVRVSLFESFIYNKVLSTLKMSSPHGSPQVSTRVHYYLRNNITYKSCCLIMHMIFAIYFTYLSGTVCKDRHQPKNERKSSRNGHFIVFVLQKIIEIPELTSNICMFLNITSHHITSQHITSNHITSHHISL